MIKVTAAFHSGRLLLLKWMDGDEKIERYCSVWNIHGNTVVGIPMSLDVYLLFGWTPALTRLRPDRGAAAYKHTSLWKNSASQTIQELLKHQRKKTQIWTSLYKLWEFERVWSHCISPKLPFRHIESLNVPGTTSAHEIKISVCFTNAAPSISPPSCSPWVFEHFCAGSG